MKKRGWYVRRSDGYPVCYTMFGNKPGLAPAEYEFVESQRPSDNHIWLEGGWRLSEVLVDLKTPAPAVSDRDILRALLAAAPSTPELAAIKLRLDAADSRRARVRAVARGDLLA